MIELPYFIKSIWQYLDKIWSSKPALAKDLLLILVISIVLTIVLCSITRVVHNQGQTNQYCTNLVNMRVSCD